MLRIWRRKGAAICVWQVGRLRSMSGPSKRDRELFGRLFILELANHHWGRVDHGLKIIRDFGTLVRYNSIKASIKLQFRDVDRFIHPDYVGSEDNCYISKTEATKLTKDEFAVLVAEVVNVGCIPMATPFDEASVDLCVEFDFPIIKVASSDVNDWPLLETVASTRRPVIVSSGGASEKNLDDIVAFFGKREIPLAINHCVSLYPSEDHELELNQIDYLRDRYPGHVIGFSSHEQYDWQASMLMSYAKGARTWEGHIDIDADGIAVSPYCTTPERADTGFKACQEAREVSGESTTDRRVFPKREIEYLDSLVRGVWAKRALEPGYVFGKHSFKEGFYMASRCAVCSYRCGRSSTASNSPLRSTRTSRSPSTASMARAR